MDWEPLAGAEGRASKGKPQMEVMATAAPLSQRASIVVTGVATGHSMERQVMEALALLREGGFEECGKLWGIQVPILGRHGPHGAYRLTHHLHVHFPGGSHSSQAWSVPLVCICLMGVICHREPCDDAFLIGGLVTTTGALLPPHRLPSEWELRQLRASCFGQLIVSDRDAEGNEEWDALVGANHMVLRRSTNIMGAASIYLGDDPVAPSDGSSLPPLSPALSETKSDGSSLPPLSPAPSETSAHDDRGRDGAGLDWEASVMVPGQQPEANGGGQEEEDNLEGSDLAPDEVEDNPAGDGGEGGGHHQVQPQQPGGQTPVGQGGGGSDDSGRTLVQCEAIATSTGLQCQRWTSNRFCSSHDKQYRRKAGTINEPTQ